MVTAGDSDPAAASTTLRLLRALREDRGVAGLDRLRGQVPAEELALAREVAELLSRRRRREAELAALYETAGDLSALRDLEDVLQALVRRARQLLGSAAAYLTLHDPERGDTYMRVTAGITTPAFQRLRLSMGAGLGGLVAATATPYSTADYGADGRFSHVIDDIVGAERLVAILGVPLRLGERVLGVLFAADRRVRSFAPEEVALLSSLGAHAAIAIENAQLFTEAQDSLRHLTEASAVISAHSRAVERAAAMHDRLTTLLLHGGGMPDVARVVAEVMGGHLYVLDPAGRPLTSTPAAEPLGRLAAELPAALTRAQESGRTVALAQGSGAIRGWVAPVVAGPQQLGGLMLLRAQLPEADLRMLERAAQVTALLLLNARSLAEAERRVRGELLDDLLAPVQRDADGLRRRATLLGADLDAEHVVVVARSPVAGARRSLVAAAAALAGELGGVAGEHDGAVVLLLRAEQAGPAGALVLRRLAHADHGVVTVGAAGPVGGPAGLARAHADAVRCQEVLVALGREGQSASLSELGVYGLLFGRAGSGELDRFVRRTLGPVLDHDAARGADLTGTLLAWFRCDGNATRTAAALFVHINTLYQRLERVAALLGPGWRHGDAALQLHLALQVHTIAGPRVEGSST